MDEYNSGMDPEVKKYFRQIINSFSVGLLWLIVLMTLGIFFRMGFVTGAFRWYNYVFYSFFLITLCGILYFFYRVWRKKEL